MCILVTGFEHCAWEAQQSLASVFRSLNETNGQKISIVICGGEKLVDLADGRDLSYLNHAEAKEWPDMDMDEVNQIHQKCFPNHLLSTSTALEILQASNGHLWLLEQYMAFRHQYPNDDLSLIHDQLAQSSYVCRIFMPFLKDQKKHDMICQLLQKDVIGPANFRYTKPLIKKLYWNNLLIRASNYTKLMWRPFFQKAGLEFFWLYI